MGAIALAAMLAGCESTPPVAPGNQVTFESPVLAVEALASAARKGDVPRLVSVLGPESEDLLSSGDPVSDRNNREVFVNAYEQKHWISPVDSSMRQLIVGNEDWPFPIPLVKESNRWRFDAAAGKAEVLARRIGRNELAAISICRTYVVAQRRYAAESRDGKPAGIYAQKVISTVGKHDGLHWKVKSPSDKPSPLSDFATQAQGEGYSTDAPAQPRPYKGYYFRILTQQGDSAPGKARDYIVNGDMTGGFALIAYPVEYGDSGIMSFLVNKDGVIHEADLGPDTLAIASQISAYNPDSRWSAVK